MSAFTKNILARIAVLVWFATTCSLYAQQAVRSDCPLMYVGFNYVDSLSYCMIQKTPDSCSVKGYNRRNQLLVEYATIAQNTNYKRGVYREYYSSGNVKGYGRFDMNVETGQWVWRDLDGKDSTVYKVVDGQRVYTRKSMIYYRMDRDSIFHETDMKAMFPSGPIAFEKYKAENLLYPEGTLEGTCEVIFVVNKDGKISNLRFLKRVNPEADQLVVDFIRNMPRWIPGIVQGKPVRSTATLTINFFMNKQEPEKARSRWSK